MPIQSLTFKPSAGLAAELAIHEHGHDVTGKLEQRKARVKRAVDFYGDQLNGDIRDVSEFLKTVRPGLKVLDVGFGSGRSTLLLADSGHHVSALEPSLIACKLLDGLSEHLGFSINVYHGPAEALFQLPQKEFDVIVFNSSFHHCDDPRGVLKACRTVLKTGGLLFLNEPVLKPFRTKKWYFRMLKEQPVRMGHYGGNEHIYYAWEYTRMLKEAGFSHLETRLSPGVLDWKTSVSRMSQRKVNGKRIYSLPRLIAHSLFAFVVSILGTVSFFRRILCSSSLCPMSFVARG